MSQAASPLRLEHQLGPGTQKMLSFMQAAKAEEDQRDVATYLSPHDMSTTVDVCIVGCGPAGLALSAQVAEKGLKVSVLILFLHSIRAATTSEI